MTISGIPEFTPPGGAYAVRLAVAGPVRGPGGVNSGMPEIVIHDDESFERALKRFKKKCERAGILSDLRKHHHYEKPSERRKRRESAAVRKTRQGSRWSRE